jgi:N-acetylglucosamine-6-sulfatase
MRYSPLLALTAIWACQSEPTVPATVQPLQGSAGRPNIVVIMTDDQTVENTRVMTHTLELIGAQGVTFDNSMVTYALCCPSRATFLTGQYPHNHGVRENNGPVGGHRALDHSNTLPVWLQSAGYVTGHIGKYLNGYGNRDTLEVVPGWTEWYASIGQTTDDYYNYRVNENGTVVRYSATPDEYKTDVQTRQAVDYITRRAPDAAPFFLFVAYFAPHWGPPKEAEDPPDVGTVVVAERHKGRMAGAVLPKPPSFNEADVRDKPVSIRSKPLMSSGYITQLEVAYRQRLESLLAVDEGVAKILGALEASGELDNTLIIFTSDNGWYQGEHRINFGKILPYEQAVKVPLMIRGPGFAKGIHNTAPIGNIDLAPTIVEASGAAPGRTMDGRSLYPFLSGVRTAWLSGNGPRHLLVEDSPGGTASTIFWSIRRAQYVYTEYANGDREFYNRNADPDMLTSRHNDPATATLRQALARRLAAMKTCRGPVACW